MNLIKIILGNPECSLTCKIFKFLRGFPSVIQITSDRFYLKIQLILKTDFRKFEIIFRKMKKPRLISIRIGLRSLDAIPSDVFNCTDLTEVQLNINLKIGFTVLLKRGKKYLVLRVYILLSKSYLPLLKSFKPFACFIFISRVNHVVFTSIITNIFVVFQCLYFLFGISF